MESLFDAPEPSEAPEVSCIECAKFAAASRDRTGWLFRMGKGYCNDDRHFGGIHNVIQSITAHKKCSYFEPAAPDVVEKRRLFMKKARGDGD